jgi:hypothetical protein
LLLILVKRTKTMDEMPKELHVLKNPGSIDAQYFGFTEPPRAHTVKYTRAPIPEIEAVVQALEFYAAGMHYPTSWERAPLETPIAKDYGRKAREALAQLTKTPENVSKDNLTNARDYMEGSDA